MRKPIPLRWELVFVIFFSMIVIARPVSFGFAQDMVWAEAISCIGETASQTALAMTATA
jgi:hypothetical protein